MISLKQAHQDYLSHMELAERDWRIYCMELAKCIPQESMPLAKFWHLDLRDGAVYPEWMLPMFLKSLITETEARGSAVFAFEQTELAERGFHSFDEVELAWCALQEVWTDVLRVDFGTSSLPNTLRVKVQTIGFRQDS